MNSVRHLAECRLIRKRNESYVAACTECNDLCLLDQATHLYTSRKEKKIYSSRNTTVTENQSQMKSTNLVKISTLPLYIIF